MQLTLNVLDRTGMNGGDQDSSVDVSRFLRISHPKDTSFEFATKYILPFMVFKWSYGAPINGLING